MNASIIVILAVIAIFCILLYFQIKRKKNDTVDLDRVPLARFADVFTPGELPDEESDRIGRNLRVAQRTVYKQCYKIYGITEDIPWIVDKISVVDRDVVEPKHKFVVWHKGAGRIILKLQPSMYFWFAREVHNVFHHGAGAVEEVKWKQVEQWIQDKYGSRN